MISLLLSVCMFVLYYREIKWYKVNGNVIVMCVSCVFPVMFSFPKLSCVNCPLCLMTVPRLVMGWCCCRLSSPTSQAACTSKDCDGPGLMNTGVMSQQTFHGNSVALYAHQKTSVDYWQFILQDICCLPCRQCTRERTLKVMTYGGACGLVQRVLAD